jgi:hypothetical protein
MARPFFKVQRDTLQVWLLLDSSKPIHNHRLEFTIKDVRHTLNSGGTVIRFGCPSVPYRLGQYTLLR